MSEQKSGTTEQTVSRERLADLLNEDLAREYQAIIGYVVYSQVLKGAEFMSIADQLEIHAHEELKHALIISRQIDYLGKMPCVSRQSFGHRKMRERCFVSIWTTKTKPSEITEREFDSVKRWANSRWLN